MRKLFLSCMLAMLNFTIQSDELLKSQTCDDHQNNKQVFFELINTAARATNNTEFTEDESLLLHEELLEHRLKKDKTIMDVVDRACKDTQTYYYATLAFFRSEYSNKYDLCKKIKHIKDTINDKNEFGNTPLITAALNKDIRTIHSLLEFNANINGQNDNNDTALLLVVNKKIVDEMSIKIAEFLIEKGANTHLINKQNLSPAAAIGYYNHPIKFFNVKPWAQFKL